MKYKHYANIELTTTANSEFLLSTLKKLKPDFSTFVVTKIQIAVDRDLKVLINGTDELIIKPQSGFKTENDDAPIYTMESLTDGVRIYAIVGY